MKFDIAARTLTLAETMKSIELTREIKVELWKLFDAGHNFQNLTIRGMKIPAEAVEKQRRLWQDYRTRKPKRK